MNSPYAVVYYARWSDARPEPEKYTGLFDTYGKVDHYEEDGPQGLRIFYQSLNAPYPYGRAAYIMANIIRTMDREHPFHISVARRSKPVTSSDNVDSSVEQSSTQRPKTKGLDAQPDYIPLEESQ